jgi:hypothetical protein
MTPKMISEVSLFKTDCHGENTAPSPSPYSSYLPRLPSCSS